MSFKTTFAKVVMDAELVYSNVTT